MIRRIDIRNFKKFKQLRFDAPPFSVIAGPNNSGKTSLLQAVAAWSEIGYRWRKKWRGGAPDLARNGGAYPTVRIDAADFRAAPVARLAALWPERFVDNPVTIHIETERWRVGFEFVYDRSSGTVDVGPTRSTAESDIISYFNNPLTALYISSFSNVEKEEHEVSRNVIASRLARGRGGEVLRGMLKVVHRNRDKWERLTESIRSFFGYELMYPSGDDPIVANYRHSKEGQTYDLASGASGFLQILMVHTALEWEDSSVLLIDEPDAHLHMLLKEKMYKHLRDHVRTRNRQAIIATHSPHIIEAAARHRDKCLWIIAERNVKPVDRQDATEAMRLEMAEIANATSYKSVLYVEDHSDLQILNAWAGVTDHRARSFLRSPNWTATRRRFRKAGDVKRHFSAMKAVIPDLCGVEIRDRNGGKGQVRDVPKGLEVRFWGRYEIENYLIHPRAIMRFLRRRYGDAEARLAEEYMEEFLPRVRFLRPFEDEDHDQQKGKSVIRRIMEKAGVRLDETEYHRIAECMKDNEVHPYVKEMLDLIVSQLE